MEKIHNLKHQISLVREALRSEKRRLGFFLGAGCPLGIFDEAGESSVSHIPDVAGLTKNIHQKITAKQDTPQYLEFWEKLVEACKTGELPEPNVEHVLTQLRIICSLKGATEVDGMGRDTLRELDNFICSSIAQLVGQSLPKYKNSYHRLAAWVSQLERVSPLEIFTPNYDLLLEEALELYQIPFFDGFVGTKEPFFDLAAIEQDKIPSRWIRLWKIHGSINWIGRDDGTVYRSLPTSLDQQIMIYPSHLKYDQSRRMPYLAMCDRLKAFFRTINPVIILCGYSFADEHLNEILLDGLRANRSAHCIALMYTKISDCSIAAGHAQKLPNLTLLAWDGAVVGTEMGNYSSIDEPDVQDGSGIAISPVNGDDQDDIVHCNLGDFHHFCLFMEKQFGLNTDLEGGEQ